MRESISIIGKGQTNFGELWDKSLRNLLEDAMNQALKEAPCKPEEIDMIVVANMLGERLNDQAQLGAYASSLLPHQPPALRVEAACASGSVAVHTACSLLESHRAENVLVLGAEKMTDASVEDVSAALMGAADNEADAPSGLTFPGIFGLIATKYMHDYELTREDLSEVSALHHKHAVENPHAQFRSAIPAEAVTKSSPVADPLCLLDCSPITDGAAACILSRTYESPIRIAASALNTDALSLTDRPSITSFSATKDAMEKALEEAAIQREDIACIELHDCFSIAALIALEDLGFSSPGTAIELYKHPDSSLSINGSGGLKACGHPVGATGVKQITDIAKRLTKNNVRYGLTQNLGGAGATSCIHILEHVHAK